MLICPVPHPRIGLPDQDLKDKVGPVDWFPPRMDGLTSARKARRLSFQSTRFFMFKLVWSVALALALATSVQFSLAPSLAVAASATSASSSLQLFDTESAAQKPNPSELSPW